MRLPPLPILLVATLSLAFAVPRAAQDGPAEERPSGTYNVDPIHSSLVFRIKHAGVAHFYGRFDVVRGSYTLDFADASACRVDLTVQAASVNTGHAGRDQHVASPDFLDAEAHPELRFVSKSVQLAGPDTLAVSGEITLRGVTRPVEAEAVIVGAGKSPFNDTRSGLEATLTILRSDFGLGEAGPGLGDEVRFTISVEGVRQG